MTPAKAAPMREDVTQARKFRKTALIEASQWFKDGDHPAVVMASDVTGATDETPLPFLDTLEGGNIVQPGDWIATGVKGEHWCIKPDVFAATYEPANEVMPFGDAIDPNASHNHRHTARHRLAHTARPDAGTPRPTQIPRWAFERVEDERCAHLGVKPNYANIDVWIAAPESWVQYHVFARYIANTARPDAGNEDVERVAELVDVMEGMWSLMRHEATCGMGCTCRYEPLAQRARALLPFRLDAKDAALAAAASVPGAA
ncbi:PGDYG domain-containing protein [Sphingomonas sp. CARO-RG-8B-R24-01]|uniref:PGDYG domain-containing protein n=1 Tax=Sphingomonas sp. CARO-RG-8B-R24-01 TaxID=2914831 RepID=UPI001F580FAD|nr:PGDYG domain-containing protein [Sphingomonas sp. CARO-RG-8B-R24-01]